MKCLVCDFEEAKKQNLFCSCCGNETLATEEEHKKFNQKLKNKKEKKHRCSFTLKNKNNHLFCKKCFKPKINYLVDI